MHCANFPNTSKLHNYRISVPQMTTDMFCFSNQYPVLSSFMTYHQFVIRVTQWVLLVQQELLSLPEHLSSPLVFSWVCVARSSVFCVMFCRSLFLLLFFFFWPLYCLSFYDLQIPTTPLVFSLFL